MTHAIFVKQMKKCKMKSVKGLHYHVSDSIAALVIIIRLPPCWSSDSGPRVGLRPRPERPCEMGPGGLRSGGLVRRLGQACSVDGEENLGQVASAEGQVDGPGTERG